MKTKDEFRASLVTYAERALKIRDHLKNEEATKLSLILPFVSMLGFDDRDPTEVAAEHASDFSEKYKNRVDYAILLDMKPIMAIECKSAGGTRKDDRGQLKSYFNAAKSVKIGILTDGIVYEFFVDSNEPNMMDDEPFLVADFEAIAKGQLSDSVTDGLFALTKWKFDPEMVSENAKRNILLTAFFQYLSEQFSNPSVEFTRFLLKENDVKHVRTNAIEVYRGIVKLAFRDVFNANVLRRLEIPDSAPVVAPARVEAPPVEPVKSAEKGIITTDAEIAAFNALRMRLAFLCGGDKEAFKKISRLAYKDYQGKMVVFYAMERRGRIADIIEQRDGTVKYSVDNDGETTQSANLDDVDQIMLKNYRNRIAIIE
ncbi:type I restriction endonuclease [Methylobrevis albus]|uniref:Type I restriction enzyme HsdR N-terminal domain-containing protein n=1 Tax=Methylobrevis albus TaxID=2793297 RepID=A0A931MWD7_9HYPH|nr:type I restriction endonuclease [Methylobrevis albus]MBH0236738.1 type I restriction enzyme HsdR N-terminal domain-containing protein [Methylobrevis albus]